MTATYQLFDALPDDEYEALKASISAKGLLTPIARDQHGGVLDGHHREKACRELGIEPRYEVLHCADDTERKVRALVMNLLRRHLTREQKASAVKDLRDLGYTFERIAEETGIPARTAHDLATASDELCESAKLGTVSDDKPQTVTGKDGKVYPKRKPKTKPQKPKLTVVQAKNTKEADRAGDALDALGDALPDAALDLKEAVKLAARQRGPEPVPEPVPPPAGKYRCIIIDPPWPMQKIERDERPNQGVTLDYPVMSLADIADEHHVPVRTLADDDCHMYLWVTHKFLPAGLDLLKAWGFNYQCVMTWRKNVGITPFSWMYDTEHVLFGRRGNLPLDRLGLRLSFEAPVQGHSRKPDVFYERVAEATPGPRVEMFARSPRDGFVSWGNEVADVD